jgi:hypothetical protein
MKEEDATTIVVCVSFLTCSLELKETRLRIQVIVIKTLTLDGLSFNYHRFVS